MKVREFLSALAMLIPTLLLGGVAILTLIPPARCSVPVYLAEAGTNPRVVYAAVACSTSAAPRYR